MQQIYLAIPLLPLLAAIVVGLFGKLLPRATAHILTILGVGASFVLSLYVLNDAISSVPYNEPVYSWLKSGNFSFEIGFLIDRLSAMMMVVVTFVSLMVHIYTIGYMEEDKGYARFFSYISLFTFAMLMLVMSNNFMQLFFGWEAVGLVSYLLIGFWYTRPTAIYANLKAFLVNRVGDFGFLLGIGLVLFHFGSLDYASVFSVAPQMADVQISLIGNVQWSLMTVTCILLFIGAMGKSAQVPLHVWLPDSMEGPTPISALIHAATMVTAGIFMVARMSPLFELSSTALSFVMIIGSITALFMGFLGVIQNDIKRIQNIHQPITHHLSRSTDLQPTPVQFISPNNTIYQFNKNISTNINFDISREEDQYDIIPKISFKEVPIPSYSLTDKFDLNTINLNISTPIHMDIFNNDNINDHDIFSLKRKKIYKIF